MDKYELRAREVLKGHVSLVLDVAAFGRACAREAFEEAAKEVDAYWKFDRYQQPLASWHEKNHLIEKVLLAKAAALAEKA